MFEPYTRARLDALLHLHPISSIGLVWLERALEAPSRNVQGSTRNVVSHGPCPKMAATMHTESVSVEYPAMLAHMFDSDVVGYLTQPPPVSIYYKGKNQRGVRVPYTGDFLVFHTNHGLIVEEWKDTSDRLKLVDRYPGKYSHLQDGSIASEPITEAFSNLGIKFTVRFSDEIAATATRNRKYLQSYLFPKSTEAYRPSLEHALSLFRSRAVCSLETLLAAGLERDAIYWAIAQGWLHIDIDQAPLGAEDSGILIFRHSTALDAYLLAHRPNGINPVSDLHKEPAELAVGDSFVLDGRKITITFAGMTHLLARTESGRQSLQLTFDEIREAVRCGLATLPHQAATPRPRSPLWEASNEALERAIFRLNAVEAIATAETNPEAANVPASTRRRWTRTVRLGEASGLTALDSLIDNVHRRGNRGPRIDEHSSESIDKKITELLSDPKGYNHKTIFYMVKAWAVEEGLTMIGKSAFYVRCGKLRTIKTLNASSGHKVAYQASPTHLLLDRKTPLHCERAMELVHFDSTLLDIELRSSLSFEILGRAWLSVAICAFSRMVLGFYLSFHSPSYVSSLMLLADIIKRWGRIPDAVLHDWGSEFLGADFARALSAMSITRHVRPKSAPRFGSVLERLIGLLQQSFIDQLPGNTKLRKNVRQLSREADPARHSGLFLADIYNALEERLDVYNRQKHPATLLAPRAMFDTSLIVDGARTHRLRNFDDVLPLLMPTARGKPRVIDPSRGITEGNRLYGHPALAALSLTGRTASVKTNPIDPSSIQAYVGNKWITCRASISDALRGSSEISRRCLAEEWRLEQRAVTLAADQGHEKLRELLKKYNEVALRNLNSHRGEAQPLAFDFVNDADEQDSISPQQSRKLHELDNLVSCAWPSFKRKEGLGRLAGEVI